LQWRFARHPYFDRFESDSMSSPLDNLVIKLILSLDYLEEHRDYEF